MIRRSSNLVTMATLALVVAPMLVPSGLAVSFCMQEGTLQLHATGASPCPTERSEASAPIGAQLSCCHEPVIPDGNNNQLAPEPDPCRCCVELVSFSSRPSVAPDSAAGPPAPMALAYERCLHDVPASEFRCEPTSTRSPGCAPPSSSFTTPLLI